MEDNSELSLLSLSKTLTNDAMNKPSAAMKMIEVATCMTEEVIALTPLAQNPAFRNGYIAVRTALNDMNPAPVEAAMLEIRKASAEAVKITGNNLLVKFLGDPVFHGAEIFKAVQNGGFPKSQIIGLGADIGMIGPTVINQVAGENAAKVTSSILKKVTKTIG